MFLEVDGHVLHVARQGNPAGPAVVLLHSLGTCAAVWDRQVAALENSFRLICPDFRGHGLSEPSREPLTIERLADDIAGVLDALEVERFHLCGISIGGMVAQVVAGRLSHRVQSLTLLDSSLRSLDPALWRGRAARIRSDGLGAIASGVFARWITPAAKDSADGRALATMLARTPSEGYAAGCDALADADCAAFAASLTMPVTVAVGALDEATPPDAARALAAAIRGAELHEIAGAAHLPLFEQSEAVNRILKAALARS